MSKVTGKIFECELPAHLLPTLLALGQHVNARAAEAGDLVAWPSVDRIAWMTGASYRTIQRHLRELEELGAIEPTERPVYGVTPYRLCLDRLPPKVPVEPRTRRARATRVTPSERATRVAPSGAHEGDTGDAERATSMTPRATPVVAKGDTAMSPEVGEVEVNLEGERRAREAAGLAEDDAQRRDLVEVELPAATKPAGRERILRAIWRIDDVLDVEATIERWAGRLGVTP